MQRSAASTPTQNATPFFSTNIWGNSSVNSIPNAQSQSSQGGRSSSRSRPGTSSGDKDKDKERESNVLTKDRDRKPSFGRKPSFSSPSKGKRRGRGQIRTDAAIPPAIPPDFALAAAASHEGRIYWFNTLLFDKPDLARMPYFDSRKLAYRATNYLLLGLSLPAVMDLNSGTPLEFLRSLNTLLAEFESYQQIHTENGVNTSSLSRARIPNMFRRGPGGRGRRQSGANDLYTETSNSSLASGSAVNSMPTSVINFGLGGEGNDLVPGEEYTHLLTPNLPFDPDFFETFATLCDVLIDCYSRLMSLLPTAKDCTPIIAELFTKADAKVRKIIIQGVVKEFEDSSRTGLKQEIASVGKVVLGGLI
ncbi:hypothetical protein GL218_05264 [Daldinia childiae]|uniref:uncharacterized protein n=1 Tax=Daldinia childiae TaxID=326645 RepID=UPI001447ABCF|nr:uncharacterized protein GL218_05264 [Daldinia childiae]KAF3058171.1 hypothetical protein GL218_05264 [Daldinia childiae]